GVAEDGEGALDFRPTGAGIPVGRGVQEAEPDVEQAAAIGGLDRRRVRGRLDAEGLIEVRLFPHALPIAPDSRSLADASHAPTLLAYSTIYVHPPSSGGGASGCAGHAGRLPIAEVSHPPTAHL